MACSGYILHGGHTGGSAALEAALLFLPVLIMGIVLLVQRLHSRRDGHAEQQESTADSQSDEPI